MEALSYCQLMERCLAAEARVVELAAENVALKAFVGECTIAQGEGNWTSDVEKTAYVPATEWMPPTPATDRIVVGIKADGVEQAANECYGAGYICETLLAYAQQLRESVK